MVGDGPERQRLEDQAESLGVSEKVIFTGFITEPAQHLALMDAFLLSSHTEGTSMTLLEAMSLGTPSVVTRVGGNPEIVIDGKTGMLTEPGNAESFAHAIAELAQDGVLYRSFAEESSKIFFREFA